MKTVAMRARSRSFRCALGLAMVWTMCSLSRAEAQADPTATRALSFSVFGAVSGAQPDYGPQKNFGFVVGGDVNFSSHLFTTSIEPRVGSTTGKSVGLEYVSGNLRISRPIGQRGKIRPYAGAGLGYGIFTYEYTNRTDNSAVTTVFGGVDYRFYKQLGARVDLQYQFWNLGSATGPFNPTVYSAGLVYQINSLPSLPFLHRH